MAKLNVRKECFEPIKNVERKEIKKSKEHQKLVEEANIKIKKDLLKKENAYENAKKYLFE